MLQGHQQATRPGRFELKGPRGLCAPTSQPGWLSKALRGLFKVDSQVPCQVFWPNGSDGGPGIGGLEAGSGGAGQPNGERLASPSLPEGAGGLWLICECPGKPALPSCTCCKLTQLSVHTQLPPCAGSRLRGQVCTGRASVAPKTQTHERKLGDGENPAGIQEAERGASEKALQELTAGLGDEPGRPEEKGVRGAGAFRAKLPKQHGVPGTRGKVEWGRHRRAEPDHLLGVMKRSLLSPSPQRRTDLDLVCGAVDWGGRRTSEPGQGDGILSEVGKGVVKVTLPSGSWVGVDGDEELTSHILMTGGSVPAS